LSVLALRRLELEMMNRRAPAACSRDTASTAAQGHTMLVARHVIQRFFKHRLYRIELNGIL